MTYFPDLSRYTYTETDYEMLNIGWLASGYEFPTGDVGADFVEALLRLDSNPQNMMRGIHGCQFCDGPFQEVPSSYSPSGQAFMGSGEIHARGKDGVHYSAPTLVIHYVLEHRYMPPQVFVEAVLYTDAIP